MLKSKTNFSFSIGFQSGVSRYKKLRLQPGHIATTPKNASNFCPPVRNFGELVYRQKVHSQVYLKKPMTNIINNIQAMTAVSAIISEETSSTKAVKRKVKEKDGNAVIIIEDSASEDEDDVQYEVDKLLHKKKEGGRVHYLVKWLGYRDEDNTWEPEDNLDCDKKIAEFEKKGMAGGDKFLGENSYVSEVFSGRIF